MADMMPSPESMRVPVATGAAATPADLLALGLGSGDEAVDLEAEIDLGEFLCACPELELHGCLGRGGMGIVYRARQVRLDRDVALKLMSPELSRDPEFAQRFEREAKALARLDHPGIVRVHDFGQAAGVYYLVMELIDGPNLRELIEQGLTDAQAVEIVGQLCDALAYAHGEGVVHRDIKPENVLLDRRGRVRVADFGLAKLQHERPEGATRTRRVLGTPQYMAPEQMREPGTVDQRCDIFAIGVVLYEMLTGQLPVGRFPAPSELGRGDARLDEIVLRALESSRERRFGAASEMRAALSTLAGGPSSTVSPERSPRRWRRWLAAGAAAAGGALVWGLTVGVSPPFATAVDVVAPAGPSAAEAVPDPAKQLNRWPAQELAVLDPDVIGVAGVDWSELRQAPAVIRLGAEILAEHSADLGRCKTDVIDRTNKIVVAFASDELRELVIHGDWDLERLRPCIDDLMEAEGLVDDDGAPRWTEVPLGSHRRIVYARPDSARPLVVSIGRDADTVVVSLRADITAAELDAKLTGQETSSALRDRVVRRVDLSAPIWVAVEPPPGRLPMGMRSVSGGIELWDELGLDAAAIFDDEAAAAAAAKLVESYANILTTVPDFPSPPEFTVTQHGDTVRVRGTIALPDLRDTKVGSMSLSLGAHAGDGAGTEEGGGGHVAVDVRTP